MQWYSGTRGTNPALTLQGDGNLVLVAGGRVGWHTNTSTMAGASLAMQNDGNLVLFSSAITSSPARAIWSWRTGWIPRIIDLDVTPERSADFAGVGGNIGCSFFVTPSLEHSGVVCDSPVPNFSWTQIDAICGGNADVTGVWLVTFMPSGWSCGQDLAAYPGWGDPRTAWATGQGMPTVNYDNGLGNSNSVGLATGTRLQMGALSCTAYPGGVVRCDDQMSGQWIQMTPTMSSFG